jgi:hypothetical protein
MARLQAEKMTENLKSLEGRQRIDPVGQIELLLNQVFLSVFQTEAARSRFGFTHISPVVIADGQPGWYLWFADRQGAFLLRSFTGYPVLHHESPFTHEPVRGVRLGVFYYPKLEEAVFDCFSWPEKILRCTDCFDPTGTPTAQRRAEIPEAYFLVGHVDIRFIPSRRFLEVECTALERWRDYRIGGLHLRDPSGDLLEVVPAGGRDRDIPGWELTRFLTDKLVLGICFNRRLAPMAVLVSRRDGIACYLHENRQVEQRIEPEISEMKLVIGLTEPGCGEGAIDFRGYATATQQRIGGELVDFVLGGTALPVKGSLWINPDWWQAQNEPFEPGNGCGCCHHDH